MVTREMSQRTKGGETLTIKRDVYCMPAQPLLQKDVRQKLKASAASSDKHMLLESTPT